MEKKLAIYKSLCFVVLVVVLILAYYALMHINFKAITWEFYLGIFGISMLFIFLIALHLWWMYYSKNSEIYFERYFNGSKYVWMVFVFLGICCIAFNPLLNFWKGIGAALFLISALLMFTDFYGSTLKKSQN